MCSIKKIITTIIPWLIYGCGLTMENEFKGPKGEEREEQRTRQRGSGTKETVPITDKQHTDAFLANLCTNVK